MSAVVIPFPVPSAEREGAPAYTAPEQLFARGLAALATLSHGPEQEHARAARDVGEALAELARMARKGHVG